eukprot:12833894-Ditylum_brightwellii.AAC.1
MELWAFAFRHAVDNWNSTPMKVLEYRTLDEVFSGFTSRFKPIFQTFKNFHPFGCPVYIMDKAKTDGNKPPKWDPCSRVSAFLGYFRDHARNVAWVMNPNTDHISAQYHVIFDDMFTTVTTTTDADKIELWNGLFPTHTKPLDIAGKFLDDTYTTVSSPPGIPQPPTSDHPMQTRLQQQLEQSKSKQQSNTKDIETIVSKGDPKEYNHTTNRNTLIITERIRSFCQRKAPTFHDTTNPTTSYLQPSREKPSRRSTRSRPKSKQVLKLLALQAAAVIIANKQPNRSKLNKQLDRLMDLSSLSN